MILFLTVKFLKKIHLNNSLLTHKHTHTTKWFEENKCLSNFFTFIYLVFGSFFFGSSLYYIELKCKFLQNHTHACYIWRMKFLKPKYKFYSLSTPTNKINFYTVVYFSKTENQILVFIWLFFFCYMISQYLDSNFINDNCKYLRKKIVHFFFHYQIVFVILNQL